MKLGKCGRINCSQKNLQSRKNREQNKAGKCEEKINWICIKEEEEIK